MTFEYFGHSYIRDLPEIAVVQADRTKVSRTFQADNLVTFTLKSRDRCRWSDRNGDDEARGILIADQSQCRAHCCPRGDTVINDHHDFARK